MRLNDAQRKLVEENHDLIYWYIHLKNLDIEEWYDRLAIELCITCYKYQPSKGSLSNFFKLRCDNMIRNEFIKTFTAKRMNNGIYTLDEAKNHETEDSFTLSRIEEMINSDETGILRLKYEGYTQTEIAKKVGLTQAYVSQIINRYRKEYKNEIY